VQEFERKLIETDSYLQILIDQVKGLDQRIEQTTNEQERIQLNDIRTKTLVLLESVKHTIVLLQIAKVSTGMRERSDEMRIGNERKGESNQRNSPT
jgi:hypothetical protein